MSRDVWLKQLRIAGADARSVEDALAGDVPVDGLQHAGSAVLRAERSDVLVDIAGPTDRRVARAGMDRRRRTHRRTRALREPQFVGSDLAAGRHSTSLAKHSISPRGATSYIDVTDGALWPAQLFDVDQGPDDFDAASDRWLLVVGLGSRSAYEVMQRFIATIDAAGSRGAARRVDRRVRRVSTVPVRTQSA